MIVLAVNLILIIIWNAAFKPSISINGKKAFCFLCGLQWTLLSGFRSLNIGDTGHYYNNFIGAGSVPYLDYFSSILPQLFFQNPVKDEPAFYLLARIVQDLGGDYRVFLIIIAVFVSFTLAYYIYDNSENPFWGFFLYSSVFYPFLSMSAERQSVAIALVGFIGFCLVKRKKNVQFVVVVAIAVLFHKSAIVGLGFLVLPRINWSRKLLWLAGAVFALLLLFHTSVLSVVAPIFGYGGYVDNEYVGSRTVLYLAAYLLIWAMSLIRHEECLKRNKNFEIYFWALTVGILLSSFAFDNSNAFRASFYYAFVMFFMIPTIIDSFALKAAFFIKYVFGIACIGAFLFLSPKLLNVSLLTSASYLFDFPII